MASRLGALAEHLPPRLRRLIERLQPPPRARRVILVAFLAAEDKRFYEHHGIDWVRVFGAIKNNVYKARLAEGFSTITMQLARNLWPEDISGRDKTLSRKLREAHVAM